ncbi:MAG: helix-turn-helix domain-containing protein [Armatimonadetes bacterium]|nr:helix-turn-helix domain-containing protein [Armatimonadota bacterium]
MSALLDAAPDSVVFASRPLEAMRPAFTMLASAYARAWGLPCALTDVNGSVVAGDLGCIRKCAHSQECARVRRQAVAQSATWGEAFLLQCPHGSVVWALPVMVNALVLGGLVVTVAEIGAPGRGAATPAPSDVHRAASDLLALAVESNLTNAALLEAKRAAARRESDRAQAIQRLKGQDYRAFRDLYLAEESALIVAIRRGDRAAAREILNRVLGVIYFPGGQRPPVLKSFLLELVVMMSRSAVEAGGDPAELLGDNYSSFADLARIETEEALCAWLVSTLERIMDAIKAHHDFPITVLLDVAVHYIEEHLDEDLSRDAVAAVACLSPSHFSRMVKQRFGVSFTELLARTRVARAADLLAHTQKSLLQVCLECGFSDQSYFTKVFQKYTGRTPGGYRRTHGRSVPGADADAGGAS